MVGIFSTEHNNNNKNINNNYNNDNDEGAETRDVLIKTVLGECSGVEKELLSFVAFNLFHEGTVAGHFPLPE